MKYIVTSICVLASVAGAANAEYKVLGKKIMDDIRAQEDSSRVQEVYDYDREAYRPQGVKLGLFTVDATADAKVTFDDNIYASDTNEESDMVVTLRPEVAVNSEFGRHKLTAVAYMEQKEFADNGDENETNYGARARLRVDVTRNSYATVGGSYALRHEARDDPNASSAATEPTEYQQTEGTIGYTHAEGKASLAGRIDYKRMDFENGETAAGTVVNNNDRDRNEVRYVAEVGYAMMPGTQGFVRGTLLDVDYDTTTLGRSGSGHRVVFGANGDLSGTVKAEAFAGLMQRRYDAGLPGVNEPTYGGNIVWSATPLTSVKAGLDRTIEETTTTGSSGMIQTNSSLGVQHELKRNILLGANANFINNEYAGITREDDVTKLGMDAKYLLNRHFSVGAGYKFSNRDSNVSGNNYDRNMLLLTLTGAL